jgi:arabinofuranosyltransferase
MKLRPYSMRIILVAMLAIYAVIVIRNAWISDDAYITFRTIENFIHGFGLTWNVDERVQTYTHPLWLFVVTVFYLPFRNMYPVAIIVSLLCSFGAVVWMALKLQRPAAVAGISVLVLSLSDAFVDYSTSGLENPLSFLLLVLFFYIFFERESSVRSLFFLTLTASLVLINRMDVILLCFPALAYASWKMRRQKILIALAAGLAPFFMWELFSLFYYGFPFPNTAYAKLGTGINSFTMIEQGWYYIHNHCAVYCPETEVDSCGDRYSPYDPVHHRYRR